MNQRVHFIFDTETTGIPKTYGFNKFASYEDTKAYDGARLLQITWKLVNDKREELETKTYFIDSGVDVPVSSTAIHGITKELIDIYGVPLESIIDELRNAMKRSTHIVAHNVLFDINVLCSELYRIGTHEAKKCIRSISRRKQICTSTHTIHWCRIKHGKFGQYMKAPKMSELYEKCFNRTPVASHRSDDDVETLTEIFKYLHKLEYFTIKYSDIHKQDYG